MATSPNPSPFLLTPPSKFASRGNWIWRIVLMLFVAALVYRAWCIRSAPFEQVDWNFQSPRAIANWLGGLIGRELIVFAMMFVLGLLTPPALFGPTTAIDDRQWRWLVRFVWGAFGLAIVASCFFVAWDEWPPMSSLLLPFISFLIGVRLSSAAQRGGKAFAWAAGQIAILMLFLVGGAAAIAMMTVSNSALEFDPTEMSAVDKRLLAEKIRDTRSPEGEPRKLQLTDAELNAVANSILNRRNSPNKASVHFEPSTFAARASLVMPEQFGVGKVLNVKTLGRLSIDQGDVEFGLDELQLGSITLPGPIVQMVSGSINAMLMDDPQFQRITEAVAKLDTEQNAINLEFEPGAIGRQIVPSLVQLLWRQPDVASETGAYVRRLIDANDKFAGDAGRFEALLQEAFRLADVRSEEHDATLENRAAIFALAILLGHQGLEPFVGEVLDTETRDKANKMIGSVALRGRQDLPRHFLVSAALALLAGESVSDRIGAMKEQIDAQQGGSGFSFVDMLANMSGTRLATLATRDLTTARSVQAKLSKKVDVDTIFPKFDGLPEDIGDAELQLRFGGVGGAGYREQMDEINRRLEALPKD
ncbi:MAG: hypothetical protein IT427_11055 [Pirellulales bacterium]|nr:hypothetical protein [Pirellulales bacterium]